MNNLKTKPDSLFLQQALQDLGLSLNPKTGHLVYSQSFKPMQLTIKLMVIRHGETYGNCGQSTKSGEINTELVAAGQKDKLKRVYQGNVDSAINQLTEVGRQQAEDVALRLENEFLIKGWHPDIIFHSPLTRAKDTGAIFIKRNNLGERYFSHPDIREISFGAWDNRRICDIESEHICHTFYQSQNALVKESGINVHGIYQNGECFADLILIAHQVLLNLEEDYQGKNIILFTHSMFGMACSILLGKGKVVKNEDYLAFDGKDSKDNSYCLPYAVPIPLNF